MFSVSVVTHSSVVQSHKPSQYILTFSHWLYVLAAYCHPWKQLLHTFVWITYVYSCYFTPQSRVYEKVIIPELVNIFPTFYGIWSFVTVFTRACNFSLSSARWIQYTFLSYFLIHFNIILPSMPSSSKWSHSIRVFSQYLVYAFPLAIYATCPTYLIILHCNHDMVHYDFASGGNGLQIWDVA